MSTTIVVKFGEGADSGALVKVELDGIVNIDSEGQERTQFYPGDQPVFLVHHDTALRIDRVECSSGMVQDLGLVSRERNQQISFSSRDAQQMDYYPNAPPGFVWYGNDAGVTVSGVGVTPTGTVPAVCTVTEQVTFSQFRLIPPAMALAEGEEWPILVVVTLEAS